MAEVAGLSCLRCGSRFGRHDYGSDCPRCRAEAPSNLSVVYEHGLQRRARPGAADSKGLWRYGDLLPVRQEAGVSLGEGGTPLHRLSRLADDLGVTNLWAKDESRNPTWSFKDRLACMGVSVAKEMGASVIVSSSTGNAGASAAAYAAKAGMACVVFTTRTAVGPLVTQMRIYGANVFAVQNKADRWTLMEYGVRNHRWFPLSPFFGPVVGSNPYGIEGYKTLAYEIAEQLDWRVPDWCVLPVCYGDAMIGMYRGFEDLLALGWIDRIPRMVAAEIYGSLGAALDGDGDALPDMPMTHETVAKSTTATRSTYQALSVLRRSRGVASVVGNDAIMDWQQTLARKEGLYAEPASAGAFAAVAALRASGEIGASDDVVVLLTASGMKDPDASSAVLDRVPDLPSDPRTAFEAIASLGIPTP